MSNSSYIISNDTMTVFHDGKMYVAHANNKLWKKLVKAVGNGNYDKAIKLIDRMNGIREWVSQSGELSIMNGAVAFRGRVLPNAITKRIIHMVDEEISTKPLEKFCGNLFANPSSRAIEELYRFLECNSLPITEDGHFLAYKRIRDNYTDVHSGTFDNSVGATAEMPRNQVMDDPNQTCSAGLHFASLEYLRHFTGSRLIAIKINPADVVSIPVDYNNSKGRCCKYKVVAELDMSIVHNDEDEWDTSVYDYDEDDSAYDSE